MLKRKGFTLIELLVVILIIGILLALIIPNFVLFQERARRSSVKNNMHVFQTSLEAFATDHFGNYPSADEIDGDEAAFFEVVGPYFPGGEIFTGGEDVIYGTCPTNPYIGQPYISEDLGDEFEDIYYPHGDLYFDDPADRNILTLNSGAYSDCPYIDVAAEGEVAGTIAFGTWVNATTGMVEQYSIVGWGRMYEGPPMYELSPNCDDPTSEEFWVFFVLHN